ncbi:MAG: chorismate synthase [Candidatus Cloacimonetes bacterium]|nr:chorismate synthase [Candidatus Cloacimonadota bacterium]
MNANTWDKFLGITSFGESHGPLMGVVIESVKPGMIFPIQQLKKELKRRRPGGGVVGTTRIEQDDFEIVSGIFQGRTTGMPICLLFPNCGYNSSDYENLKDIFRPGHGDYALWQKFKIYDYRGGGRISGRETIARVAAGALVNKALGKIRISSRTLGIGPFQTAAVQDNISNELYWPDKDSLPELLNFLQKLKDGKDSVGGLVEVQIENIPAGLGDPVFEKLEANLAQAIMSIGGVRGFEIGTGFQLAEMTGQQANDQITSTGFLSNHAGGIAAGITTGQPVVLRYAVKPTSSIGLSQQTIDTRGRDRSLLINGRHDTCLIPRIIPVAEAMIKLVLADAISYQRLLAGKKQKLSDLREAVDKIDEDILVALLRRTRITQQIGRLKRNEHLSISDADREKKVLSSLSEKAANWGFSDIPISDLWQIIFRYSKSRQ